MGKIIGLLPGLDGRWRSGAFFVLTLVLGVASVSFASDSAFACRGGRYWSTGADLGKLMPGEIVVRATLIESYKGEQTIRSIMGLPYGMIYYVQISKVVGGADGTKESFDADGDVKIFVRLEPSVCERYFPNNFTKDVEKVLVLKKGATGLYELVGGQE